MGEISADLGATIAELLDKDRRNSTFGNLRLRHSLGREYFTVNHVVMKLLNELGLDVLAKCYGFNSPKQVSFFMLGTLSHKSLEFITICREIITDRLITEWFRSGGKKHEGVDSFIAWLTDDVAQSDKHFSDIVFFVMNTFPSYAAFVKGIRVNMKPAYNGERAITFLRAVRKT